MLSQADLESVPRSELVERARELGVERPERMTRVELRDEMIRRTVSKEDQAEARGLFGVARSMLASVVETGLNLPDAAKVIRGDSTLDLPSGNQTPVATVTLAEIYAAQGHKARALRMLDEVLRVEPEHQEALRVQAELNGGGSAASTDEREKASRTAVTAPAPPVEEAATPDYVPGGFVDTEGEEIRTGKPPVVEEVLTEAEVLPQVVERSPEPEAEAVDSSPSVAEPLPSTPVGSVAEEVAEAPDEDELEAEETHPAETEIPPPALILAQTETQLSIYWELPALALEHCGVDLEHGDAALRLVAFSPDGTTPQKQERTVLLSALSNPVTSSDPLVGAGALRLDEYRAPAAVRAAIGWATEDGFLPLCVGRTVEEWGGLPQGARLLCAQPRISKGRTSRKKRATPSDSERVLSHGTNIAFDSSACSRRALASASFLARDGRISG